MTTQGKHPMNEIVDNVEILSAILDIQRSDEEIVQGIRNVQKELMGFKRLVLTQLIDLTQMLTTLIDVLIPPPPQETTLTGMDDRVMEPPTEENSPSARVPAEASLPAESAHHDHAVHHQPVSPADQEPSDAPTEGAQQLNKDTSTRFGT